MKAAFGDFSMDFYAASVSRKGVALVNEFTLFMMTYPSRGYELVLILDLALRARCACGMRLSRFRGDRGVLPGRRSVLRRRSKRSVSMR